MRVLFLLSVFLRESRLFVRELDGLGASTKMLIAFVFFVAWVWSVPGIIGLIV